MNGHNILDMIVLQESMPRKLAQEAWDSRLYVRNKHWSLMSALKRVMEVGLGQNEYLLLAKLSTMPVGVAMLSDGHIEVYVKKAYRRYGIGTILVQNLKQHNPEWCWGSEGLIGSKLFWEYNKIGVH